MNILSNSQIFDILSEIIANQEELFLLFDEIYLFGSILYDENIPNDIDLLLVYSRSVEEININLTKPKTVIESIIGLPVDLTVLNQKELKETNFLKRIKHYIRFK